MASHPCLTCGACCAYFRVSFYWREAEPDSETQVPVELTDNYSSTFRTMKGTSNKHHARCVALEGKVGEQVGCSIYQHRPTPCRAFDASFENGEHNPRCDQARAKYGLRPLQRKDWLSAFAQSLSAATMSADENKKSLV